MEWYLNVMKNHYSDFYGRSRRMEFWMFRLIYITGGIFGILVFSMAGSPGIFFFLGIYFIVHFIPELAITIRRLHDSGNSGWCILFSFIPYLGALIMFIFMVLPGEEGPNQWGPDPKNPDLTTQDLFCEKCGNLQKPTANFCNYCGESLSKKDQNNDDISFQ